MSKSWTATWWLDLQSLSKSCMPISVGRALLCLFGSRSLWPLIPWLSAWRPSSASFDRCSVPMMRLMAVPRLCPAAFAASDGLPAWWDASDAQWWRDCFGSWHKLPWKCDTVFSDRRSLAVYVVAFSISGEGRRASGCSWIQKDDGGVITRRDPQHRCSAEVIPSGYD